MEKVARNARNGVREGDAQCAQSTISTIKIVIRLVQKYGSKTWALRKAVQNLLEQIWMMGIKRTGLRRSGMILPCGDKDCIRCSNENMEDGSGWTPKDRKTETEVE